MIRPSLYTPHQLMGGCSYITQDASALYEQAHAVGRMSRPPPSLCTLLFQPTNLEPALSAAPLLFFRSPCLCQAVRRCLQCIASVLSVFLIFLLCPVVISSDLFLTARTNHNRWIEDSTMPRCSFWSVAGMFSCWQRHRQRGQTMGHARCALLGVRTACQALSGDASSRGSTRRSISRMSSPRHTPMPGEGWW